MSNPWPKSYQEFKNQFEKSFLDLCTKELTTDNWKLTESIEQSFQQAKKILTGGKRIRAYLSWLAAGPNANKVISFNISACLEFLHAFALVHDDIIDQSPMRRDELTVHEMLFQKFQSTLDSQTAKHQAQSQAILVGDFLLATADDCFYSDTSIPNANQIKQTYKQLKRDIVYGQMLDTELAQDQELASIETINLKTQLKTAHYTLVHPLQLGALINPDYTQELLVIYEKFGYEVGMAFQLQDDLLNILQPESITGKPQFNDILNKQQTIITLHFNEHATNEDKHIYTKLQNKEKLNIDESNQLHQLLDKTGSLKNCQNLILSHFSSARQLLENTNLSTALPKTELIEFIDFLSNRNA